LPVLRQTFRYVRTIVAAGAVLLLVLGSIGRGDGISDLRAAAGRSEQDLVQWEITHFMDKWVRKAANFVLLRSTNAEEPRDAIIEFFALRDEKRGAEAALLRTLAAPADARSTTPKQAQQTLDEVTDRRGDLSAKVEEALEGAISGVLSDLGIIDAFGPVRWPPVDFTFEDRGLVLVRSPRDRIDRLDDLLLDPGVSLLDQEEIEEEIETLDDTISAVVVRVGGVATYPAQVSPNLSLHGTLALASHEWLHHWLYFRPLGRGWFDGGEIRSINETLANIFGKEVGDLALERLTGQVFERAPWVPPTVHSRAEPPEDVFDFRREMRQTRVELESLLDAGEVDEAEAFLERRRLEFVANGFNIRKLNNAWFAFNGTYADSPGSISPIEGQLRTVRADSASLSEFLDRLSGITEPGELEALALGAGWVPIDPRTGLPIE
jgi:hypothetical protein